MKVETNYQKTVVILTDLVTGSVPKASKVNRTIVTECNGLWIKIILSIIFWDAFSSLIRDRNTCVENCHQYWNVINAHAVIYTETNSSRQKSG